MPTKSDVETLSEVMSEVLPKPPPIQRGPLPRVLVQYLQHDELRRDIRIRGGSAAEAGPVRQIGIDPWHPLYVTAAAIADLAPNGVHTGSFLLQVGFRANVRGVMGVWVADGPVEPAPGGDATATLFDRSPSVEDLLSIAVSAWSNADPSHTADLLDRRRSRIEALLSADEERRKAGIEAAAAKLAEHPLFNIDRFNEVAHEVPEAPAPIAYRPPGRLLRLWWWLRSLWGFADPGKRS